ncbi:hypothetical protein ACGFY8_28885 [Streptomyces sp. NPDC048232]|uniref:hypothetical protein n=2 Tax=unclassified Streptomyces TaxID=2593676 RepID=UPI003594905D
MGDTGGCRSTRVTRTCPPTGASPMPRLALYALVVCVLAVTAAVVSFVQGSVLIGVVWVLLSGLSSNMCWYYVKRGRDTRRESVTG